MKGRLVPSAILLMVLFVITGGCQQVPIEIETYRADRGQLDQVKRFAFVGADGVLPDSSLQTALQRAMGNHAPYEIIRTGPARATLSDAVFRQAVNGAARRSLESRGYVYDAASPQVVIDVRAVSSPFVIGVPGHYHYHRYCDYEPFYFDRRHRHFGYYYGEYEYHPPYEYPSQATVVEITVLAPRPVDAAATGVADSEELLWRGTGTLVADEGGAETIGRFLADAILDEFPKRSSLPTRRHVSWKKIEAAAQSLD